MVRTRTNPLRSLMILLSKLSSSRVDNNDTYCLSISRGALQSNLEDSRRTMKNISRQCSRRNNQRNINRRQRSGWGGWGSSAANAPALPHREASAPATPHKHINLKDAPASDVSKLPLVQNCSSRRMLSGPKSSIRPPNLTTIPAPTKPLDFTALSPGPKPRYPCRPSPLFCCSPGHPC
jgi:hypothetical protein